MIKVIWGEYWDPLLAADHDGLLHHHLVCTACGHIDHAPNDAFDALAADIESGKQPLDGRAMRRAEMYMQASRSTFYAQKQADYSGRHPSAQLMVRSIRAKGDSCKDCIELDHKWLPFGSAEYIPIGQRQCVTSCRCSESYGYMDMDGQIVETTQA